MTLNAAFALGFALLGLLVINIAGPQAVILVVAGLYFLAAIFCWTLPPSPPPAHTNGGANLAYGSAKGGVATLTYGMAQQLGPHGIRVNAVAPGIIDTPMVRGGFADAFEGLEAGARLRTPLGRLGQPEDVAEVIAFLLSPGAAFTTGALVPVTGGIEILAPISVIAKGA